MNRLIERSPTDLKRDGAGTIPMSSLHHRKSECAFHIGIPVPANTIMWHPCYDPVENHTEAPAGSFHANKLDATAAIREQTNTSFNGWSMGGGANGNLQRRTKIHSSDNSARKQNKSVDSEFVTLLPFAGNTLLD